MVDMNLLGKPTFSLAKEFTGNREQFDEFCYKLRAYMNLLNPGYSQIFKMIEGDPSKHTRRGFTRSTTSTSSGWYIRTICGYRYKRCEYGTRTTNRPDYVMRKSG